MTDFSSLRDGTQLPAGVGNLLCVSNFRPNAGYAWDFIESLYAAVAEDLAPLGVRTYVAYPTLNEAPAGLKGNPAEPIELDVRFNSLRHILRLLRTIRERRIRVVYMTDREAWHPAYALLHLAGVEKIIVHDHTSGERTLPVGIKLLLKRASRAFRPAMADVVLAVSEFVRQRKIQIDLLPPSRVQLSLNSVEIPEPGGGPPTRELFGIPSDRPLLICACRAAEYKGVQHLLRAMDLMADRLPRRPVLLYFGDGPFIEELSSLRRALKYPEDVVFAGYQSDVASFFGTADLCVVPSTWQEAFGLAALEPGARGVPVVASAVGGIPEIVDDGETGLLVPPASPGELAEAIVSLLEDPSRRARMGEKARARATAMFSRAQQIRQLTALFRREMNLREKPAAALDLIPATGPLNVR